MRRVPTTEASRRCSLVGFLREIRCSFWGPLLRGFATGICLLADQNLVTSRIGIGPDLCGSLSVLFFVSPFFEQVDGCTALFSEKIVQKTGTCTEFCRGSELFSGPEPHSAVQSVQRNWTTLNDRICSPHTHAHTLCVLTAGKSSFRLERSGRPFPTPITLFCSASRTFQHLRAPACFGRWHSPQVAPAAPPAPRVHSSISGASSVLTNLQPLRVLTSFR